jgi:hypothetical protein
MKYIKQLKERVRSIFRSKKKSEYNLVKVFEHEGHTYYRFPKELNLPLERFSMSMGLLERLSCGISGTEMELILEGMEKALGAGLSNAKNAALVAAYIHIIRERQDTVIHRDILLNIAATWIVREDENPSAVSIDIHEQKLQVFEKLSKGGAKDFFYNLGIAPLMPLFTMSPEDFQTLWEYNLIAQRKLKETIFRLNTHRDTGQRKPLTT